MIALADLVLALELVLPDLDSGLSESVIKSAVRAFNDRAGWPKHGVLTIVAGTASYAVPDDFAKLVRVDSPFSYLDNVVGESGIIPMGNTIAMEQIYLTGRNLVIYPTPLSNGARTYWYKARHALDGSEQYPDMDDAQAEIILVKAQAVGLGYLAAGAAGGGWKYQIGDVSIDKSGIGNSYQSRINDLNAEFERCVTNYNGPAGVRPVYPVVEV